jgi:LPXTG-motif cell wall-anchored protein
LAQSSSSSASASALADDGGAITARGADTAPLNPDGTCPEGYVTVNAPFCAQESPNTPGRIFGYGEGDLATASATASATATPTATATATSTATTSAASAAGGSLPDTGGSTAPLMGIGALMLLAGAGIMSFRIVRRSS